MAPLYNVFNIFNIPLQKISYKTHNNEVSKTKFLSYKLPKSQNSQVSKFPIKKFPSYKMPNDYKIPNCYKILKLPNSQLQRSQVMKLPTVPNSPFNCSILILS